MPCLTPRLPGSTAEALNRDCHCRTLDAGALRAQLEREPGLHGWVDELSRTRPHLFSSTVVFLSQDTVAQVSAAVAALSRTLALPAWRARALARAPAIARLDWGPQGAFMGFDFHLGAQGPRLIEINTNAGGAWLNAALARAQRSCGEAMDTALAAEAPGPPWGDVWFDMLMAEWRLQRGSQDFQGVLAIVDDQPASQYLAPEFELCRLWCRARGVDARVADAADLAWRDGRLWLGDAAVGMVYNRLTDFYLASPESGHLALRQAHEAGAVVLTPSPRAHALFAEKRNLVALADDAWLAETGVPAQDRATLAAVVPHTVLVTPERVAALWADRRHWFFKPVAGHGAKRVYRGDKLTRRVWAEIAEGGFVAQALVPAGERQVLVEGAVTDLKFDLRAYAYAGHVQLLAARLYAGQTTNFRTPGGGFAPVVVLAR